MLLRNVRSSPTAKDERVFEAIYENSSHMSTVAADMELFTFSLSFYARVSCTYHAHAALKYKYELEKMKYAPRTRERGRSSKDAVGQVSSLHLGGRSKDADFTHDFYYKGHDAAQYAWYRHAPAKPFSAHFGNAATFSPASRLAKMLPQGSAQDALLTSQHIRLRALWPGRRRRRSRVADTAAYFCASRTRVNTTFHFRIVKQPAATSSGHIRAARVVEFAAEKHGHDRQRRLRAAASQARFAPHGGRAAAERIADLAAAR